MLFETKLRSPVKSPDAKETKPKPDWLWIGSLVFVVVSVLVLVYEYWATR
jgi:hypothetical protein